MQLVEFVTNHWPLVTSFIILAALLGFSEFRARRHGAKPLTPQEATRLMNKNNALLIDIRDLKSFEQGHVLNALHIPNKDVAVHPKVAASVDAPIILLCQTGFVAPASGEQLRKRGHTQVFFVKGGIQEWQAAGLPLTKRKS